MKKIMIILKMQSIILILSIGLGTLIHSCKSRETVDEMSELLEGQHKLRKLNIRNSQESSLSGSFFLGTGSISGSSSTIEKVQFSWELPNGQFAISVFETSKIRIEFDSTAVEPIIRFELKNVKHNRLFDLDKINHEYEFYWQIKYVVVVCREEDYIIDVDINKI